MRLSLDLLHLFCSIRAVCTIQAIKLSVTGTDMMHTTRKSFMTMRLDDNPGGGSSGWNRHHFPSHQALNGLTAEPDWPLGGAKTMGPRQIRR